MNRFVRDSKITPRRLPVGSPVKTDVMVFDSIDDVQKLSLQANHSWDALSEKKWTGRYFRSVDALSSAISCGDRDGAEKIEKMIREIDSEKIAPPISRRRIRKNSDSDGSDLNIDRLRSGRSDFWESRIRADRHAIANISIVVEMATSASKKSDAMFWRGACAVALARLLEVSGRFVQIWAVDSTANAFFSGPSSLFVAWLLKDFDRECNIPELACGVSSWFYRNTVLYVPGTGREGEYNWTGKGVPGHVDMELVREVVGECVFVDNVWSFGESLTFIREAIERL